MSPPHSYTVMQFRSIQNDDDDDDICPVCESECTCGNNNVQSTTAQSAAPLPSPPSTVPTPVPLKIKLPARSAFNVAQNVSTAGSGPPSFSNPKQTTADSAIVDGSSSNYVIVHRPGPFSAPGHQLGTPTPMATASTSWSLRDTSPLTPEPELEPPSNVNGRTKQSSKAVAPKNKRKATVIKGRPTSRHAVPPKKLSTGTRRRKNKDATWTTNTIRRRGKRAAQTISDGSADNLTDEDAYVTRMGIDSDGTESVQFPTFISAISTTSDNDDSASTMTDSFDSDSSIRAEEEDLILAEQRAKVRREILNNEESWHMEKRKWDHLRNNNNWEIRPRKRSVGPDEADGDTSTESDDSELGAEEEEEEGDDDDDPDIRYGHGMVTGWQSDDDDFDAELFFATLTDSSGPGSDADVEDSGDEHSDNSDLSSISMTEAAAARLLSSSFDAGCPLVVTEDWDGRLVFANGLKDGQGVLDVHFEVDAAQRHRSIREAMEVDAEDTEGISERVEDEEDENDFISDDGGETTDDMLDHRTGINTPQGMALPFRCPTPPVASIDPLSTFSPIAGSRRNRIARGALDLLKPADILAGASKMGWEVGSGDASCVRSPSASIAAASTPETTTSSSHSRQMPTMGSFEQVSADPKKRAVIDGSKAMVFSPFTRTKRAERRFGRGRKRSAAGIDIFPYISKRPRQSSLPGSSRAPLPVDGEEEGDPLVQSSPELPLPATSIDLDDVLDVSFLGSDDSVEPVTSTSGERHLRNLSRWDRVPINTFRRSRTAHMGDINARISQLAPPNDGVSYGSAGGHVLKRSPLGVALWQTSDRNLKSKRNPGSVAVSPVIFPVRDGERTPTTGLYLDPLEEPLPANAGTSKSHKQKRKEKKTRIHQAHKLPASIPASNGFHHPLPIVPSLNL
ncbi:hypothetical protein JB92DRAFT_3133883 [Gautieria morchelliformis]|nr:hypothetical protein JB92DRAFT_3133883 [Gautieria morchelliformis]